MNEKHYEVVIVGGGISGAALFYELAKYTTEKNICIFIGTSHHYFIGK